MKKSLYFLVIAFLFSSPLIAQDDVSVELDFDAGTGEYIVSITTTSGGSPYLLGNSQIGLSVCDGATGVTISSTNLTWGNNTTEFGHSGGWDYYQILSSGGSLGNIAAGSTVELFRFTAAGQPTDCAAYTCDAASLLTGEPLVRLYVNGTDPISTSMPGGGDFQNSIVLPLLGGGANETEDISAVATCPLPVELLSFDASPNRGAIELTWATASETNNSGFEIYRSINPRTDFERIGWVEGAGNSADRIDYEFTDGAVRTNIEYYYKLKQIDFDGAYEYSDVESAKIASGGLGADVRPNPAKQSVEIVLDGDIRGNINVSLIDIQGRMISSRSFDDGNTSFGLDVSNLPAGVYMVKVQNKAKSIIKKLIVE